jgi:predicted permease
MDLRYSLRLLLRSPMTSFVAVITVALGVGVNTAMFSFVHAVLLQPLPYREPDRLVAVWGQMVDRPQDVPVFASVQALRAWQRDSRTFEQLEGATWAVDGQTLRWRGVAQRALAIPVTSGFFSLLGVAPARGRTFNAADLTADCTVVLSDGFWKNRLGGSNAIVGGSVTLNNRACTVIGVMPPGFEFYPKPAALWTLITPASPYDRLPLQSSLGIFGRVRSGVSWSAAQAELAALHSAAVRDAPADSEWRRITPLVKPLQDEFAWLSDGNLRSALLMLFGAVCCVLLIACANLATLQLSRAAERQRELAIRVALGSSRARLVAQLLTESLILALTGAALGAALAFGGVAWFRHVNPVELPPGNAVAIDWTVLAFTGGLAILTGLLSGLLPARRLSRPNVNETLASSTRGATASALALRTTRLFVVAEVALSVTLLTGAGLLAQSLAHLQAAPLGFRTDHLLTGRVTLQGDAYQTVTQRSAFYDALIARLRTLPSVEGADASTNGGLNRALGIVGRPAPETALGPVNVEDVSPGYHATMGIALRRGRSLATTDVETSLPVALVNEALVQLYFRDEDPIGKQVRLVEHGGAVRWLTIVGTTGNVAGLTMFNKMAPGPAAPLVYRPLTQSAGGSAELAIRTRGGSDDLARALAREVAALDPDVPVHDVKTMERRVADSTAHPRFRAIVLSGFAGLALLLAALGIYGLLANAVSQRRREMAVRIAVGAERRAVLALVLRQGLTLTVIGAILGIVAALWVTRLLTTMLYGVTPADPLTLVAVVLLLLGVGLLASYVPARRAAAVDPLTALRQD